MRIIILAAGQGIRLRPFTDIIPKPMLEFGGKTLLGRLLETIKICGIDDISIVTGHNHNIINFPEITYFRNERFMNTNMMESLFCAKEKLEDSVIISYADIIFEKKVLIKLMESKDDVSIIFDQKWEEYWKMRVENPIYDANETVLVDKNNFVLKIGHKIENTNDVDGHFIGLMKVQNDGTRFLKEFYEKTKLEALKGFNPLNPQLTFEKSRLVDLLQGLINAGYNIKGIPIQNGWLEFDTVHDYEVYNKMRKNESLSKLISLDDTT